MPRKLLYTPAPKAVPQGQRAEFNIRPSTVVDRSRQKSSGFRLDGRCAAWMLALLCPSLLLLALMTIPSQLFNMQEHEKFYFFWREMDIDPFRWAALVLAAACTIFALVMPLLLKRQPDTPVIR